MSLLAIVEVFVIKPVPCGSAVDVSGKVKAGAVSICSTNPDLPEQW